MIPFQLGNQRLPHVKSQVRNEIVRKTNIIGNKAEAVIRRKERQGKIVVYESIADVVRNVFAQRLHVRVLAVI